MKYPTVTISAIGASYLRGGQKFMYRNNLVSLSDNIQNGDIVRVLTEEGEYVATGFYSEFSHIVVRVLSRTIEEEIDRDFFRRKIRFAVDYRKSTQREQWDNCRIIYGEADGLSGLTCDRYNDILVTQISCSGMEKIRDMIYGILKEELPEVNYLYERNDIEVRKKEHLPLYKGFYGAVGSTQTVIVENGIKIAVDVENGQKTGYFLDQKNNRKLIQELSYNKKVLDCFSHTGGFALNAAKGNAKSVTAVDVSMTALEQGRKNAEMNGLLEKISFVQADVFDYLKTIERGQFDLIILDPPAFTKSRRTVDHAYRGYLEINEDALNALKSGGYLATCSCSRYMENALFEEMIKEAAGNADVTLRQISITQQNSDHPILWNGENKTEYLKFYLFQIVREGEDA